MFEPMQEFSAKHSIDCYLYVGYITREGYNLLTKQAASRKNQRAYLFLATFGGDPDAGFRIARALRHYYQHLTIVVPSFCKSAGTLVAIGADELVIADKGELGPLDMQLKKPDEISAMTSGLDITQAMSYLRTQANDVFKGTLLNLSEDYGISTRTALDVASKMALGIVEPIFSQIDPNKIGETQRAIFVAFAYGDQLNAKTGSLKAGALQKLVLNYPAHSFVIDRKEASELFNKVRPPTPEEASLLTDGLYKGFDAPTHNPPFVILLATPETQNQTSEIDTHADPSGQGAEGLGGTDSERLPGHEQGHEGDQPGPDSSGQAGSGAPD